MIMWHLIDVATIALLVIMCAVYAFYTFSSIKLKRAILTLLVRVFGVRVFNIFSPRLGGCSACSGGDARQQLRRTTNIKQPTSASKF
jgi:steroid 5-alpha reductase family enzyme